MLHSIASLFVLSSFILISTQAATGNRMEDIFLTGISDKLSLKEDAYYDQGLQSQGMSSCKCENKINEDLLQSLKDCVKTLTDSEGPCEVNIQALADIQSCACVHKRTRYLEKALKSCTDAVNTILGCKSG